MNVGEHLEVFSYQYLLEQVLATISPDIDTREGSIIYDALAPACMALAEKYMQLKLMYRAAFVSTSFDNYLDLKVADQGLVRMPATRAVKLGVFTDTEGSPFQGLLGVRFSSIHPTDALIYVVIGEHDALGSYRLQCESYGTVGNSYVGDLLPISHINGLGTSIMSTLLEPGQNVETDDNLRARFMMAVNTHSFGGNITQYRELLLAINGIGAVQVYPVVQDGDKIICSLITSDYLPISDDFITDLKIRIDPPEYTGQGIGLVPIGHQVIVTTPSRHVINIRLIVELQPGMSVGQVSQLIEDVISAHFKLLRSQWGDANDSNQHSTIVFRSRLSAAVLTVQGVVNVSRLLLNGEDADIILSQTRDLQEVPILGGISYEQ